MERDCNNCTHNEVCQIKHRLKQMEEEYKGLQFNGWCNVCTAEVKPVPRRARGYAARKA